MKTVENNFKHEQERLNQLMEISPVGIVAVNQVGQVTYANAPAERILGLSRSTITERTYNDIEWRITDLEGNPFPDEELAFRRVMTSGPAVYGVQHGIERADGSRVLLSINAAPKG